MMDKNKKRIKKLIEEEKLKDIFTISLKKGFASEHGTDLNSILPKMSPLNPKYLTKKREVFKKISSFVKKFREVGEEI
jgi:type I restriction enzyme R subunit